MLFAGIDIGSLTAQAVLLDDGNIILSKSINVKPNPVESARAVMGELLEENNLSWSDIGHCVSTGYGREKIQDEGIAQQNVSEISCHGLGALSLVPQVRTVIDIGGQDAKVIRVDERGELVDFVMNDKCAAGTGRFLEVMCRTLGVALEELGPMSQRAKNHIHLSSRCSIYAETEVLHYLQRGVDRASLAAGINRSMAHRVMALIRRVGVEKEVLMSGGVAKNVAVRAELEKMMNVKMVTPRLDPQLIGAYGASIIASRAGGAT
jgi:predicted CoA-substrate-specific enzyme activase